MVQPLPLRRALHTATPFPLTASMIDGCCLDWRRDRFDTLFRRARGGGLASIDRMERSGHLWRVVGEVAESVAVIVLDELRYTVFWQITQPGIHGVDLLFLSPDEAVLARSRSRARCAPARFRA